MIHVFFVPGMFGSTIEYVLRNFTKEHSHNRVVAEICADGSMHAFKKQFHNFSIETTKTSITQMQSNSISTPMYPFPDQHLSEILDCYHSIFESSRNILVHADSLRSAELNLLFQYYKIAFGSNYKKGLSIFCGKNSHNIVNWNKNYTSWTDMQSWELREWFSLFYPSWVEEWIQSVHYVDHKFLKITNTEILHEPKLTMQTIIDHCGYSQLGNLDEFLYQWADAQFYIVNKFLLLDEIIEHTLANTHFIWNSLDIISEAIIQQRLRQKKFEIRCDGLNIFPTNSKILYNLLERC